MKVLCDYHHHDLWESLELLAARLGWTLYRPMGMEWFDQGYWNFERAWHGDAVARQYLEPWGSDTDVRYDPSHGRYQNLLTLEQARDLRPDIVLASVAHNHEGLARFASEVGATFGLQLGNVRFSEIDMAEDRWDLAAFGLVTTLLPVAPPKPHVVHHQEFSLLDFRHEAPEPHGRMVVSSFVNCFAENTIGYGQFRDTATRRPGYDWRVYGSYGSAPEDEYARGNINTCRGVADAMLASDVAWHTKQWSDGFGHVIHNWFAVGRPVLGYEWYYRTQLAGPLWEEGVTSFDLTDRSPSDAVALLDRLAQDDDLRIRMGDAAAARFREVVNYAEEADSIRRMLAQVLP
jgi:hypothetical protein